MRAKLEASSKHAGLDATTSRRRFLGHSGAAAALLFVPWKASAAASQDVTLKIGDQKGGAQAVMEAAGALKDLPYRVEWKQFPAAAPLLEALNAGAIDSGFAGDAPRPSRCRRCAGEDHQRQPLQSPRHRDHRAEETAIRTTADLKDRIIARAAAPSATICPGRAEGGWADHGGRRSPSCSPPTPRWRWHAAPSMRGRHGPIGASRAGRRRGSWPMAGC